MKQLPPLLEPWRPWLSLFPADLAAPLGELLLRLHRQIGPLRSAPARDDALPEGVGSIVQRGPYERMLITEWAYADAEPDEFIRRAASGELMFTGPEPAARRRSRRCVALFDAGPAQLGEPRLLHLALFILLARRAEEAGSVFEWGILQEPTALSSETGTRAIQRLLGARTLSAVGDAVLQAWEQVCDGATDDAWIIGGHGYKAFGSVRGQIAIRRSLLAEQLEVSLTLHQSTRALTLELPATALGIRLLRSPFEPIASRSAVRQSYGHPALEQTPRFSAAGNAIAVAQVDGDIVVFDVPRSTKNAPGKTRRFTAPPRGSVLGAGVFGKSLGCIVVDGETLVFRGFPGDTLTLKNNTWPREKSDDDSPQDGPWLHTFFQMRKHTVTSTSAVHGMPIDAAGKTEETSVLALDREGALRCWSNRSTRQFSVVSTTPLIMRVIANYVIGVAQFGDQLLFACARENNTELYSWNPARGSKQLGTVPRTGTRLFFGDGPAWSDDQHGLVALQCSDTDWLVGNGTNWETTSVKDNATVLGVAVSRKHAGCGLVVRTPDKTSIEMRTRTRRIFLVTSDEPIAQASVHPLSGDMAWIGGKSLRITVRGIDNEKPYLQVSTDGEEHAK